jgi:hypothetical protein
LAHSRRVLLLILVLTWTRLPAFASGGSECDYMACYSFFMPDIIKRPQEALLFRGGLTFPYDRDLPSPTVELMNIQEWDRYFDGAIPKAELSFLVYKMRASEVTALADSLEGKQDFQGSTGLQASLKRYPNRNRVRRALQYLVLAKQVEPIAMSNADRGWNSRPLAPPPDPTVVQTLIEIAEQQMRGSDSFLTQRYRFQVMRLMYYTGQFSEAQKYFERYKGSFTGENTPKYRFMDLAAGAYYKDKQFGKANYIFSLIFDKFQPLKFSAYRSFHPMEDSDWRETLSLAKTVHEKEVLWQLLGIYADGLEAMEAIHAVNPRSDLLPLLLVREVNTAEARWTANESRLLYYGSGGDIGGKAERDVIGPGRVARIRKIADARKTSNRALWLLATGHLLALSGDSKIAEQYILDAMKSQPNDEDINAQGRMSLIFARVRAIKSIARSSEPWLATELTWLRDYTNEASGGRTNYRARTLNTWILNHLRNVYREGSDSMRALLLTDSPESDSYRSVAGIDAILEFIQQAKTPFDMFLVRNYEYSVASLQELRAINFLYSGNFSAAVEAFRLAGGDVLSRNLRANPFMIHIKDCHDCDFNAPHTNYTKMSFAERMLALSRDAQGQGEAAALASFELANGLYNMSSFGNARDVYDTRRSNLSPRIEKGGNLSPALQMDLTEGYYLRAARLSANPEFGAKATFMAAKAEQNRSNDRKHFQTLRDSYSGTQYYQEIIKECGYFKNWLGL